MTKKTIVGIDFDNTIVCYDAVFHAAALERTLIPPTVKPGKESVRDYLRSQDRENDWTELQGFVYGKCMPKVRAFPGALEFFVSAIQHGFEIFIISHKTQFPYLGARYDLHRAAVEWLELSGFFDPSKIGLNPQNVFFETSKANKLSRIAQMHCTHFIDDLPEILLEPDFPVKTKGLLFSPMAFEPPSPHIVVLKSWNEISRYFELAG